MDPVRINKALADAGVCSRRKADELVAAGLVRVNGDAVTSPGLRVRPDVDVIDVRGRRLPRPAPERAPCYLLLHKPVAVVSTASDPDGRSTVLDFVPPAWRERRLYPAGRLDFFSEGLVLLTDDGEMTYRLTHPSRDAGRHLVRVYHVLVRGKVADEALLAMRRGMTLAEGEKVAPVEARILPASSYLETAPKRRPPHMRDDGRPGRDAPSPRARFTPEPATIMELRLRQGLNRQIRRMCRDLGLTVLRLVRVAQGPLELGDLRPGSARPLVPEEIASLRRAVGLP